METIGQFTIEGGYKTFTAGQLVNILGLVSSGAISHDAGRVILAAGEMKTRRDTAARVRAIRGIDKPVGTLYREEEAARLLGMSARKVSQCITECSSAGLLDFSTDHIVITGDPLPQVADIAELILESTSPERPVPLSRPIIRWLCRLKGKKNESTFLTALACLIRGLWLKSREKLIRTDGRILNDTLGKILGLTERAVQKIRQKLTKLGLIRKHGRNNRKGWGFVVNVAWNGSKQEVPASEKAEQPAEKCQEQERSLPKGKQTTPKSSPHGLQKCPDSSPLNNNKTLYRLYNHKLVQPSQSVPDKLGRASGVGFSKSYQTKKSQPRGLWNVQAGELLTARGIETCYQRGIDAGVIKHSEMNRFSVFSAAASVVRRIGEDIGDRAKIFAAIVRSGIETGCWTNISTTDENRARRLLDGLRSGQDAKTRVATASARSKPKTAARGGLSPKEAQAEYERSQIERQKAIKAREQQIAAHNRRIAEELERDSLARIREQNEKAHITKNSAFLASLDPETRQKLIDAANQCRKKAALLAKNHS